ncbi:twin-arginine translocation pathway signal protein [Ruegeria sp.]|uniref:twin-arginine translocation pathway signal protein n=1 Tax=Ruegeria sp. TaxID=1879320 RepID=UPI002308E31E|nr:twin-arginine translocation pathway signal protein [Ruegeria sp.]MDA7964263.1 twin-arginine translocation pathway signal protein [Ruegeria sp.]
MKRRSVLAGVCAVMIPHSVLAATAPAGLRRAQGQFTTGSTSGGVALYQDGERWAVFLEDDFAHEGSPDPWVAFGQDGFRRDGIIGELAAFEGPQVYPVGPKLNVTEFNEVYIWCVEHNTSLGRARLSWL